MDDIDIIYRQTGISKKKVKETYIKNNQNIIDTICELNEIEIVSKPVQTSNNPTDPEILAKIDKLRTIVNEKDAYMDNLTKKTN